MRRRPEEDNAEQQPRGQCERVGDRGPPHQSRHSTGSSADDDVLLGRPLEPERVHEDVEEAGADGQNRREQVDAGPQKGERSCLEHEAEDQRRTRGHRSRDERTPLRSIHQAIDVAIDVHVEGVGSTSRERAANHRQSDEPHARQTALGHDHRGHGGDEEQLDDARLGQHHERACSASEAAHGGGGHHRDLAHRRLR